MKNNYRGGIPISGICFVFCLGAILFSGCVTSPAARNSDVSLDRAIQIAVENIEQGMGQSDPDASVASAASAERAMRDGNMDLDAIRQQAQDFAKKPVIAVLNINSISNDYPPISLRNFHWRWRAAAVLPSLTGSVLTLFAGRKISSFPVR
jgi:hypothetical protein